MVTYTIKKTLVKQVILLYINFTPLQKQTQNGAVYPVMVYPDYSRRRFFNGWRSLFEKLWADTHELRIIEFLL